MEKLLEYQKLDTQLFRLQMDMNKNENRKEAQSMASVVRDAQSHILSLEKLAKNLCDDIEKLKEVQNKGVSLVEKYSKQSTQNLSEQELVDLKAKIKQASKQLNELEKRLLSNEQKSKQAIIDFNNTRKKATHARACHQEAKAKFDEFCATKEPEINELKSKMQELEKVINPDLIGKYKAKKQEKIFPVIVPLVENRCGGCRMELPKGAVDVIKEKGKLECPSCRRLIYIKN